MPTAALSFDIEDWFHPELVRPRRPAGDGRSVVRQGVEILLELLDRHDTRATFFLLGEVVNRHPDLVRRLAEEGHEIACHGMTHRPLWELTPEAFRQELHHFRAAVRSALGQDPVVGYRAPTFSLDRSTAWALPVLREEGFRYDSSIFPVRMKLYGIAGAPLGIYRPARDDLARHDPEGAMVEFPVAVARLGGLRLPVAGGFYLRALPLVVLRRALRRIQRERPFVVFLHPWECVPDLPRVHLGPVEALVTYLNLGTVTRKLDRLLGDFRFAPVREVLEAGGHIACPANHS